LICRRPFAILTAIREFNLGQQETSVAGEVPSDIKIAIPRRAFDNKQRGSAWNVASF
jgi:hypothetical protein